MKNKWTFCLPKFNGELGREEDDTKKKKKTNNNYFPFFSILFICSLVFYLLTCALHCLKKLIDNLWKNSFLKTLIYVIMSTCTLLYLLTRALDCLWKLMDNFREWSRGEDGEQTLFHFFSPWDEFTCCLMYYIV